MAPATMASPAATLSIAPMELIPTVIASLVQFLVHGQNIHGKDNTIADAISRNNMAWFYLQGPKALKKYPDIIILEISSLLSSQIQTGSRQIGQVCSSLFRGLNTLYQEKWLGHSTIKCYLAAVRSMQINYGFDNPFDMSMPRLDRVMKGIKVAQGKEGRATKRKLPITQLILCHFKGLLDIKVYEDSLLYAAAM
uniref:Uncharacterized protein n=1 Tax=Amphimedon queenslandica TaxID=400682 RepID=A0A1X7TKH8_AMPQE